MIAGRFDRRRAMLPLILAALCGGGLAQSRNVVWFEDVDGIELFLHPGGYDYRSAVAATRGTDHWLVLDFTTADVHGAELATYAACAGMRPTWKDDRIEEWLRLHGIAASVDAQLDEAVARSYDVWTLPTVMVVLGGYEVDRRTGVLGPGELLSWFDDVAGQIPEPSSVVAARSSLPLPGTDAAQFVRRVHRRARDLLRSGAQDDALALFVWLWELPHAALATWARDARALLVHDTGRLLDGSVHAAPALFAVLERRSDEAIAKAVDDQETWRTCAELALLLDSVSELSEWTRSLDGRGKHHRLGDALREAGLDFEAGRLADDPVAEATRLLKVLRKRDWAVARLAEFFDRERPAWHGPVFGGPRARVELRDALVGLYVGALARGLDREASQVAALLLHTVRGADVNVELAYQALSRGQPRFEQFAWLHAVLEISDEDVPRRRALRMIAYLDWALYEQACGRDFEPLSERWRRPAVRAAQADAPPPR